MAKISQRNRILLQTRAEELLKAGNDEATAAAVMVAEKLCSEPVARGIVQWVIANEGKKPRKKQR